STLITISRGAGAQLSEVQRVTWQRSVNKRGTRMGVWGAGLFDNDDTADLRADYRAFLADAQSDAGATDAVAVDYAASLERPQDTTAVWLALASIQWRLGRLDPRVKAAAFAIIDGGLDLALWEASPLRKRRAAVLAKLRTTLSAPMPAAKA